MDQVEIEAVVDQHLPVTSIGTNEPLVLLAAHDWRLVWRTADWSGIIPVVSHSSNTDGYELDADVNVVLRFGVFNVRTSATIRRCYAVQIQMFAR